MFFIEKFRLILKASDPEKIYNMDEMGMPLDPRPPKVVATKGQMIPFLWE